jgi:hypothetical protein
MLGCGNRCRHVAIEVVAPELRGAALFSSGFPRTAHCSAAARGVTSVHASIPMRSLQYVKPSTVDRWFDKKSARFFRLQFNFFAMAI